MKINYHVSFVSLVIGLTLALSCNSLVHNTVNFTQLVSDDLAKISSLADSAVTAKVMSKEDRQLFAKEVMLPAIDADQKLVNFLKTYDPSKPLPTQFTDLTNLLTTGLNKFILTLPNALERAALVTGFNVLNTDLTNWINSLGGK